MSPSDPLSSPFSGPFSDSFPDPFCDPFYGPSSDPFADPFAAPAAEPQPAPLPSQEQPSPRPAAGDAPPPRPAAWQAARPPMAATARSDYLEGLNAAQRQAVQALDGPVLVLSGAGTGKTRVLTTRLAHLLTTGRASPFNVLAVTFTNKAAREMRERVAALIGAPVEGWWLGTFHALAARMLRRHAELVGINSAFNILDTDDQLRLIRQVMEGAGLDSRKNAPREVLSMIERWKDRGLTPDQVTAGEREGTGAGAQAAGGRGLELYRAYQGRLRTLNACDFGDLLLHTLTIFQAHTDVLAGYHRRFQYILVDEYQDTNVAQYLWLRLLAQGHRNLCCVGDEDQSIYGWRGAEIGNILRFEHDFPGATVVRLEENYRSTGHILGAASGLIAHNRGRLGKTLWTAAGAGAKVRVVGHWDSTGEAVWVGDEIEALQRRGARPGQVAVLVRTGAQTREFEERFLAIGLPYRVLGGPRFYERLEIRDALAYLRLIIQPADDLAFERIINTPKRGIGPAALQTLQQAARGAGVPLLEAARRLVDTGELKPKVRTAVRGLVEDFERWRRDLRSIPHTDLARQVLDDSGYVAMWRADTSPDAPGRLENLKELINAMANFGSLGGFLEHVALVMEATEAADADVVSLMTLHGAKGLEFPVVFLPGWEDGLFPNQRALDSNGNNGLEEERRLAYVGLTRARKQAYVCYANRRRLYGYWADSIPSRFLTELPAANIEVQALAGVSVGPVRTIYAGDGDDDDDDAGGYGGGYRGRPGGRAAGVPPVVRAGGGRVGAVQGAGQGAGQGSLRHDGAVAISPRRPPPPLIEARPLPAAAAKPRGGGRYRVGQRIGHDRFGQGTIEAVEGDKLEIAFDSGSRKRVLDSFVRPVVG